MASEAKPEFEDLRFSERLLTFRVKVLEGEPVVKVVEGIDYLIDGGFPEEELLRRARVSYLGKQVNSPEMVYESKQPEHQAFRKLEDQIEELRYSWDLFVKRIERFANAYDGSSEFFESPDLGDLRKLGKELDRFTRDTVMLLSDFPRILSGNDLSQVDSLRDHFSEAKGMGLS